MRSDSIADDFERCYRLSAGREARYDGVFFIAVTSTHVYCRPSCPARKAKRENVRFYPSAAAAQAAGFRACKRCRPDRTPGSPDWNWRQDTAARAVRLIADGTVDREGTGGLARRLQLSQRQLRRLLTEQLGAGPLALARAQRVNTARVLIESTDLPFTEIAFSSGFGSVRQFNETVRTVFGTSPGELRHRARNGGNRQPGVVFLRLTCRAPFDGPALLALLEAHAVPGIEELSAGTYRRSLSLPHGAAVVELTPAEPVVECALRLDDHRDLTAAVARCRRLLDLDADPEAVAETLGGDDVLGPLLQARPGLRVPGCVSGDEVALRAVAGQCLERPARGRTELGRLVVRLGKKLDRPFGGVTHLFPRVEAIAEADPRTLPVTRSRQAVLHALARGLAAGDVSVDAGSDPDEADARLRSIGGIAARPRAEIRARAFHDPDGLVPSHRWLAYALDRLGHNAREAADVPERWRPWRSYAAVSLWTAFERPRAGPRTAEAQATPYVTSRVRAEQAAGRLASGSRERGVGCSRSVSGWASR